jgi:hypothetical protein
MIEIVEFALVVAMLPLGSDGCDEHSGTNDSGANNGGNGGNHGW